MTRPPHPPNVAQAQGPFTETHVFCTAALARQIHACEAFLARADALVQQHTHLMMLRRRLDDATQELEREHSLRISPQLEALARTQEARVAADDDVQTLRELVAALTERSEKLNYGNLDQEDLDAIADAIREARGALDGKLLALQTSAARQQDQLSRLEAQISACEEELGLSTVEMAQFRQGAVPPRSQPAIIAARQDAASRRDHVIQSAQARHAELSSEYDNACALMRTLEGRILDLRARDAKLKAVSAGGFFDRVTSSTWWGSLATDYENEAVNAERQLGNVRAKVTELAVQQVNAQATISALRTERPIVIERLAAEERDRQQAQCQARLEALPLDLRTFRLERDALADTLTATQGSVVALQNEVSRLRDEVAEKVKLDITAQVTTRLATIKKDLDISERNAESLRQAEADMAAAMDKLAIELQAETDNKLSCLSQQVADVEAAIRFEAQSLASDAKGSDIEFDADAPLGVARNIRTRIAELERLRDALNPMNYTGLSSTNEATEPADLSQPDAGGTNTSSALGRLYFDFVRNEDDNQDSGNRTFPGLRSQLVELRRKLGSDFFPDAESDDQLLDRFLEAFFPEGVSQAYYICNLSLSVGKPFLSLRPQFIGPRLMRLLPRGRSLAVCGRLWDNRIADNPVFMVQRIVDISHSERRPFEQAVSGFVSRQTHNVYPVHRRQDNLLTDAVIAGLPPISLETQNRLQDWRAYLDWRDRLIRARLVGLRYLSVILQEDGRLRFLTVSESKEKFERVRRTLRSDELNAYGPDYSTDPWTFAYNKTSRDRGSELGDFAGQEDAPTADESQIEGMPWEKPYYAHVYFRLPEDVQNAFDAIINATNLFESAAARCLEEFRPSGFLAPSIVGDMSLVQRQRTELKLLQDQSGHAPFLSSYLFDIEAANVPAQLKQITDDIWLQASLNEDQRLAVRKMISTPDIGMVQGPPGTGKTTMIAEATWQFVREGKKVLLVSQASLAVNNALERLPLNPAIRAIRLRKRERKNEREHPYSGERALGTYYASVSATCRARTLDVWSGADARLRALKDWFSSFDLVGADVDALRTRAGELRNRRTDIKQELDSLRAAASRASQVQEQLHVIESFRTFLRGGATFSGELPECVLDAFYSNIIERLNDLPRHGIRVNALWSEQGYGSLRDRSGFAVEALLNWRSIVETKSQLAGDRDRLIGAEGDSVLSSKSALRLAELERQSNELERAMEDDASKIAEWQAVKREIRDIKRQGSGLDRPVYVRLFNVPENEILTQLISSGSAREEVIRLLTEAHALLKRVESEIMAGIEAVVAALDQYGNALCVPKVDHDEIRRTDGDLRYLTAQLRELEAELEGKERRLEEIVASLPQDGPASAASATNLPALREAVARDIVEGEAYIAGMAEFRNAWGDLLERWVKDLEDPDTLKNDQENFFSTYASACNVVGVTCTENRRTLEDAGHNWFDTVIVDEVSKATPTEIIMPLMMARTAILVGDHRQLPPLFKETEGSWEEVVAEQEESQEASQEQGSELTPENFDRFKRMVTSSLFKEHFENAPDGLKSFLFTQYRMHPQIMRVVNQFYENRLECGLPDPDGKQPGSDPRGHRLHGLELIGTNDQEYVVKDRHVVWLDSTRDPHGKVHHERRDLGSSKVNELECILIARALHDIEMACRAQGHGANGKARKEVGIVTFYGRQVRAIREAVRRIQTNRNFRFEAVNYDINTVDRYQGQERPIILVSMVRNPEFKLSSRANTAQFERINVAFSRAQELLVVAGAKDVFCQYPVMLPYLDRPGKHKVEVYRYIIDEIHRNGGLRESGTILSPTEYDALLPPDFKRKGAAVRPARQGQYDKRKK